jgi:hypothetical protein
MFMRTKIANFILMIFGFSCTQNVQLSNQPQTKKDCPILDCLVPSDTLNLDKHAAVGCGFITLIGYVDSLNVVIILVDSEKISIGNKCQAFDLTQNTDGLELFVYHFSEKGQDNSDKFVNECGDIIRTYKKKPTILNKIGAGKLCFAAYHNLEERDFFCNAKITNLKISTPNLRIKWSTEKFVFYKVLIGTAAG